MSFLSRMLTAAALALGVMTPLAAYQTAVDQADPSVIKEELRQDDQSRPRPKRPVAIAPREAGSSALGEDIVAGAIRIEGAQALPPAAFAPIVEKYAGRTLGEGDLAALAAEIAGVARRAGFGLATAWVPQQRVSSGLLTVVLDEGRIDGVDVQGTGAEIVQRHLAPLARGVPVKTSTLERQLLVANDTPGIRMGRARLVRRGGQNILAVRADRDPVRVWASIDNWGSPAVGPVRARLTAEMNGLLDEDDRLTIGGIATPLQPREFALGRLSYSKVIGTAGTQASIGGYYARSEPGGVLADLDIEGRSSEIELGLRHPFHRSRAASVWGSLDLRLRESEQTRDDVKVRDDRLTTLTGGAFAVLRGRQGRARIRISLVQGLDIFDPTRRGDPLASRADGRAIFSKIELWAEQEQQLGRGFSLLAAVEAQAASRPLLSSEEMGLGGRYFGRAWDYREFSGDKGIAGSLELRFDLKRLPKPAEGAQLYAYLDAGSVGNYEDGFGGGSLASAGGGIRFWLAKDIQAGIEAGFPLSDGADPDEDRDPRISFTVGTSF